MQQPEPEPSRGSSRHTQVMIRSRYVGAALALSVVMTTAGCASTGGKQGAPVREATGATSRTTLSNGPVYATSLTTRQIEGMAGVGDRFVIAAASSLPEGALSEAQVASMVAGRSSPRKLDAIVLGYLDSDTPAVKTKGNWRRTFDHRLVWLVVSTGPAFVSGPSGVPRPSPLPVDQVWTALDPVSGNFLGARTLPTPESLVARAH